MSRPEPATSEPAPSTDASATPSTSASASASSTKERSGPAGIAPTPARPLRADARRNRAKVLEAAREVFAAEGLAVPLDEIARRAGVGAGTVYRHFPTKEALFEAVVVDRLDALAQDAEALLAAPEPGPAFFEFFTALIVDAGEKMDLADMLANAGVSFQESTLAAGTRMKEGLDQLLARAQAVGAVRADVTSNDLHALAVGAVAAERRNAEAGKPTEPGQLTQIICDGLAAGAEG